MNYALYVVFKLRAGQLLKECESSNKWHLVGHLSIFGAAELTWWASDKLLGKGSPITVGTSGNTVDVVYNF